MSYRDAMHVLIVDDQPAMREALEILFDVHGLPALTAATPEEALDRVRNDDIGVVLQDMNFQDGETSGQGGSALFRSIRALDPDLPVLLMTAWTSLETAVELVKEGAADYFAKPWNDEKLVSAVRTLLRLRTLWQENTRLRSQGALARRELARQHELCGLVYASQTMHELLTLAVRIAPSEVPVLITGPNGSGKELLAEIVRSNSRRRDKPFVKVNAGGLPDQLLEAELFGAEAGAFTGANKQRVGRFEAAHGGTLFLDELGNLSASGQMKLLRVLQSGEYERLGSSTTRRADVRVISATNADLQQAIAAGQFREDLYFRLNVIELKLPALAQRPEDIAPLSQQFLTRFAQAATAPQLAADALDALLAYSWPGNVRELQNRLQRASLVCRDGEIRAADLALPASPAASGPGAASTRADKSGAPAERTALAAGEVEERERIEEALLRAGSVVSKAAAELGLSRQALYRRMERLGLSLERRVRE
jgi:DNA-binding NtrC family response regulator